MTTSEPAYLVRRIADTWIAADETFSQFYELEPAKELEPQRPRICRGWNLRKRLFYMSLSWVIGLLNWGSWVSLILVGQAC